MELLTNIKLTAAIYAGLLVIIGYIIAGLVSSALAKATQKRFSKHQAMLIKRLSYYTLITLFFIAALQQLGFKLTVLLGAAGVFTVALSFASKTAMSNLISGIFLLFEHPFKVGDIVEVKSISGTVNSIDLMSTKIVTFDNRLVRIPNETLIKSDITNLSHFSTRRADITVGVSYDADLEEVQALLVNIAKKQTFSLDDPEPKTTITNLADSAIEIRLSVWTQTENLSKLKSALQQAIQSEFNAASIDIPFPQLTVHKA